MKFRPDKHPVRFGGQKYRVPKKPKLVKEKKQPLPVENPKGWHLFDP